MMNRNQLKLSTIVGIGAILASASFAQAAVENPLDPSYYADKVSVSKAAPAWVLIPYTDSGNPLHPSFERADGNWEETAAVAGATYVDRHNPLHPTYQKSQ
jgi:hypothetical protein